jgi:hypothetical protein
MGSALVRPCGCVSARDSKYHTGALVPDDVPTTSWGAPSCLGMNTSEHGRTIRVNRAPVLTLWATVVAERLGFDRDAALTLGRAVAGSSAQMKGRALGIYEPSEEPPSKAGEERRERLKPDEAFGVRLLGRTVPAIRTPEGIRAMEKDFRPASAASVGRYLASKFGDHLDEVRAAMEQLAASQSPDELNRHGFALYEAFRPAIPAGARGWGAAGELNLERITDLARGEP